MSVETDDTGPLDLVICGGRVFDPASGIDSNLDVGIRYGQIVAVERDLAGRVATEGKESPEGVGTTVIDATGRLISPGFVDLHAHVYVGVCPLTVQADETSASSGVTTVVSAGDAGAHTIEGFRRLIVEGSRTRVLAFLHVASIGLAPWPAGESTDLEVLDVQGGIRAAVENPDIVVGVKVRMTAPQVIGRNDLEPLRRAVAIAAAARLPIMLHIGSCPRPVGELMELLRPGDIVTHCFASSLNTLAEDGGLAQSAHEARRRGILFDVGHGSGSFSYRTAAAAIREGFWPDTISTDIHALSVNGPVYDLPTTMSKFLALGMPLADVVERVTSRPAAAIGRQGTIGSIAVGRPADLTIFDIEDSPQVFHDAVGGSLVATSRIRVHQTIRAGLPWRMPLSYPGRGAGVRRD